MQSLKHYFTKPEVSRPETFMHMLWSLIVTLIVLYFVAEAILVAFFSDTRAYVEDTYTATYSVLLLLLLIDIAVTLNRGIYLGGILKLSRKIVVKSYLKCRVYVDLIVLVILALSIYLPYSWAGFLRLVIFIKLQEVWRFDRIFFRTIHTHRNLKQLYLLFKLVLALMYLSHLLGCLFYYMDYQLILSSYYGNAVVNPERTVCSLSSVLVDQLAMLRVYSPAAQFEAVHLQLVFFCVVDHDCRLR